MFTGIIEELGQVKRISRSGNNTLLEIKADKVHEGAKTGDSFSVNGACLTLVKKEGHFLTFEVMPETMRITNLSFLRIADKVNLERALRVNDRLGGHLVTGHIDGLGRIKSKRVRANNIFLEISIPRDLKEYIVPKGSIAVEGISLTINEVFNNYFTACIIPHTMKNTNLVYKRIGDKVNIEVDILGKYVRQSAPLSPGKIINEQFLKEKGFI